MDKYIKYELDIKYELENGHTVYDYVDKYELGEYFEYKFCGKIVYTKCGRLVKGFKKFRSRVISKSLLKG